MNRNLHNYRINRIDYLGNSANSQIQKILIQKKKLLML